MLFPLLQSPPDDTLRRILWPSVGLIIALVVGLVVVSRIRRGMRAEDEATGGSSAGFTLSDLREMHKAGEMSDEEFEKAKAKVVESARKAAERKAGVNRPVAKPADVLPPEDV